MTESKSESDNGPVSGSVLLGAASQVVVASVFLLLLAYANFGMPEKAFAVAVMAIVVSFVGVWVATDGGRKLAEQ